MGDSAAHQVLIAGSIAAFTVDLLVYPLDTIKTRIQSRDYQDVYASKTQKSGSTIIKGTLGVQPPKRALFKGLYQGIGSVIFATLPAAGVFFYTYESSKSLLSSTLPSSIPIAITHSLASAGAELASCLVLTPAEVIKQNAQMLRQSSSSHGKSTSLEALNMVRHGGSEGVARRLFSGYTALAARNLPFTALQFPLFEGVRKMIWEGRDRKRQKARGGNDGGRRSLVETGVVTGLSAAVSGSLAAFVTTPTDVVKTRMMLAAGEKQPESAVEKDIAKGRGQQSGSRSGFEVAKEIFRERGIRGLFRGGALRTTWAAFGSGLYLGSYEVAKVWLKQE
ncbi:mitochondrial carrier domain-containing protein [Sordaria brevicollis]|uniref:Mitochondrial carrier domain-containing protein n=1 Tax=Sordaria brevicollis TaxID=83679 RepID=A0AAE0UD94_SORBR|nr:mitochondrial carrier domain-containing protein [Sordaria brevicollis]